MSPVFEAGFIVVAIGGFGFVVLGFVATGLRWDDFFFGAADTDPRFVVTLTISALMAMALRFRNWRVTMSRRFQQQPWASVGAPNCCT
jgi:hypothetical protein